MSKTVEFYFDFTSPYSYLAATRLPQIAEKTGAEIAYKPILLGALMDAVGNRPPATCRNKAKYMMQELQDIAVEYGVPFTFPAKFPIMALMPLRGTLLIENDLREEPFIQQVFRAYWGEGKDITKEEVIAPIAEECELNWTHFQRECKEEAIKQKLKDQTNEAVERGLFGVPTFFVDGKMYFGNESLPRIEKALAE